MSSSDQLNLRDLRPNSSRPTRDEYFATLVRDVSTRGSCLRRKTGCILVNSRYHIIATGYNGPPSDTPNCFEEPCEGATAESGTQLGKCGAIHAEANALLQCGNVYDIETAYCTTSPCIECTKLLANTSCKAIVFLDEYPHKDSKDYWVNRMNRVWYHYIPEKNTYVEELEQYILAASRYQPTYNGRPSCPFCGEFIDSESTHKEHCIVNFIRQTRHVR